MPNRNIYVSDTDVDLWDRAAAFAVRSGQSISGLIVALLRRELDDSGAATLADRVARLESGSTVVIDPPICITFTRNGEEADVITPTSKAPDVVIREAAEGWAAKEWTSELVNFRPHRIPPLAYPQSPLVEDENRRGLSGEPNQVANHEPGPMCEDVCHPGVACCGGRERQEDS